MPHYWWDDALALAIDLARGTEIKHSVTRGADGFWMVEPLFELAPAREACS